jgi:hypothetical protein
MKNDKKFLGWEDVAMRLGTMAVDQTIKLNIGQRASLNGLAKRLPLNGVIIADEVGMGKTRIAATLVRAVTDAGGRVAILVPPGLGFQWGDELRNSGIDAPPILRSLWQYLEAWKPDKQSEPWFLQSTLIVSHSFSNWRLRAKPDPWRWALLPEVYANWRKKTTSRWPRGYSENENLTDEWVRRAAKSIVDAIDSSPESNAARKIVEELARETPWPGALNKGDGGAYGRDTHLRPWLERA